MLGATVQSVDANVADMEALQASNPNLEFQYGFEGSDDTTRLADGSGNGYALQRVAGGSGGDVNDIGFVSGYDGSSQAYRPATDVTDYKTGAGLNSISTNIQISTTVTIEAVLQMDAYSLSNGNGSYILSARPQPANGRAYFLRQMPDGTIASTLGDTFGDLGLNLSYVADDWYYLTMVASYDGGANQTSVSWYYANLSNGDTALTDGGTDSELFQGDWSGGAQVGLGCFLNGGQEFLDGNIDSLSLTNEELTQETLQSHLDALVIPEPASVAMIAVGGCLLAAARRRSRR